MPNVQSVHEECYQDFKDADKYTEMWKGLWSIRDTAWHLKHRNPSLVRFASKLFANKEKPVRMLFPMCGKVVDMNYFWKAGHEVFGVDCATEAIQDFFKDSNIPLPRPKNLDIDGNFQIYSTNDRKLNVINGNFFTLNDPNLNGTIECVWDRGAFGTITENEQILYINTMKRLLAPDFRYLLLVTEYDETKFTGVPFSQPEEKVNRYYGDFCNIEKLDTRIPDHVKLYQEHMSNPLEVRETVYFLTPKY